MAHYMCLIYQFHTTQLFLIYTLISLFEEIQILSNHKSCDNELMHTLYWWISARQQYFRYYSNGDAAVLHRYFMMTSSDENIFRVTGPLCGEFTGPGEFPTQSPVTRSFDVFFDLRLNKPLNKQSWGWWFETLSRSLWRHRNVGYLGIFLIEIVHVISLNTLRLIQYDPYNMVHRKLPLFCRRHLEMHVFEWK